LPLASQYLLSQLLFVSYNEALFHQTLILVLLLLDKVKTCTSLKVTSLYIRREFIVQA
jgi:hypothetical protein